jgi:hypothetical protein
MYTNIGKIQNKRRGGATTGNNKSDNGIIIVIQCFCRNNIVACFAIVVVVVRCSLLFISDEKGGESRDASLRHVSTRMEARRKSKREAARVMILEKCMSSFRQYCFRGFLDRILTKQ